MFSDDYDAGVLYYDVEIHNELEFPVNYTVTYLASLGSSQGRLEPGLSGGCHSRTIYIISE